MTVSLRTHDVDRLREVFAIHRRRAAAPVEKARRFPCRSHARRTRRTYWRQWIWTVNSASSISVKIWNCSSLTPSCSIRNLEITTKRDVGIANEENIKRGAYHQVELCTRRRWCTSGKISGTDVLGSWRTQTPSSRSYTSYARNRLIWLRSLQAARPCICCIET